MIRILLLPFIIIYNVIVLPFKLIFSLFTSNKNNNIWGLSKEDKKIAREERMSDADYIEAEERDDDNLDDDD